MSVDARLDAVTKARSAYVLARTTLESRLRDELKKELANLQTQVDIAVRYAYDAGAKKASISRALGTRDHNTLQASLERTEGFAEIVGVDPLDSNYSFDMESGILGVSYENHGPSGVTDSAEFQYKVMEDGTRLLLSNTPLFNDDYSVRNMAVAVLDQKQDGYYYEEAMAWLDGQL